jgi:hypothetical protein
MNLILCALISLKVDEMGIIKFSTVDEMGIDQMGMVK